MTQPFRDIDKDSLIQSFEKQIKELKDIIKGIVCLNVPFTISSISLLDKELDPKKANYLIQIKTNEGNMVASYSISEKGFNILGKPTAGTQIIELLVSKELFLKLTEITSNS